MLLTERAMRTAKRVIDLGVEEPLRLFSTVVPSSKDGIGPDRSTIMVINVVWARDHQNSNETAYSKLNDEAGRSLKSQAVYDTRSNLCSLRRNHFLMRPDHYLFFCLRMFLKHLPI
jgi:hypothetical protein